MSTFYATLEMCSIWVIYIIQHPTYHRKRNHKPHPPTKKPQQAKNFWRLYPLRRLIVQLREVIERKRPTTLLRLQNTKQTPPKQLQTTATQFPNDSQKITKQSQNPSQIFRLFDVFCVCENVYF